MLDHQHGVAQVAQALQDTHKPIIVARMQPDGRFVEHVERTHKRGPERGRQIDALALATTECLGQPVEREVVESYIDQVFRAGAQFFKHTPGYLLFIAGELDTLKEVERLAGRHGTYLSDLPVVDLDVVRILAQAVAVALRTRRVAPKACPEDAVMRLVRTLIQKLKEAV